MAKRITLVPAYGRDYKNKKTLLQDFNDNKDFIIMDMSSPYDTKPANKSDLKGYTCMIRYERLTKICVIDNK